MSFKYKSNNPHGIYFITTTIVDWVDLFTRPEYKIIITDSLNYCISSKGLKVYAWVLMSNHIHLIAAGNEQNSIADIIRDFKKFTSKKLFQAIQNENESRRQWLYKKFLYAGKVDSKNTMIKIWQDGYHPIELDTNFLLEQKLDYIHNNPVKQEIVLLPEHYLHSSARDYCGEKGLVNIELLV
jgi:putative transposase